jgi:hypothetical protein
MRVSAYERVASLVVALLVIIGFAVSVLVLLWWARRAMEFHRPVPIEVVEDEGGRDDPALGVAHELEEPGVEELAEVERPQLADTVAAVTTAVSSQQGALDENFGNADVMGRGRGRGDRRGLGDGGEGNRDIIARNKRWELKLNSDSVSVYARQLDSFGIELAAFEVRSDQQVALHYASKVSTDRPMKRSGLMADDDRLCFAWLEGPLEEFDRQLLAKAGVDTQNRIVGQFYSPQLENTLAQLEKERSGDRPLEEIRRTTFDVKAVGDTVSR